MSITVRQLIDLLLDEHMDAIVTVGVDEATDLDLENDVVRDQNGHRWVQLQTVEE